MLKIILCKLLKIHLWKNSMCSNLYAEGVDEFYRCRLCGETKIRFFERGKE